MLFGHEEFSVVCALVRSGRSVKGQYNKQAEKQRSKHLLHTQTRQPAWPYRYRPGSGGEGRPGTAFLYLSSYTTTTATRSHPHRSSSSWTRHPRERGSQHGLTDTDLGVEVKERLATLSSTSAPTQQQLLVALPRA